MGALIIYLQIAFCIALVACLELFWPVVKETVEGIDYRILYMFSFLILAVLLAPFLIGPIVIPNQAIMFREALTKELKDQDK